MTEIMALGVIVMMMMTLAVAIGGFVLEALFFMLGRSLQAPALVASFETTFEPADIHLSYSELHTGAAQPESLLSCSHAS